MLTSGVDFEKMPDMTLVDSIKEALEQAATACFANAGADCQVTPCRERKFGDYQSNFAFRIAKREKLGPRDAAAAIVKALPENETIETATVAGAGFINIRVKDAALAREAMQGRGSRTVTTPPVGPTTPA